MGERATSDMLIHLGELRDLKPRVNYAERSSKTIGHVWGPRTIPDCQLLYVVSGAIEISLGPDQFVLESGNCAYYGSNSPHMLTISKETTYCSIHFDWNTEDTMPRHPVPGIENCYPRDMSRHPVSYDIGLDNGRTVRLPHRFKAPSLEPIFGSIVVEYREQDSGYEFVLRSQMMALIASIVRLRIQEVPFDSERRKIAPALEAIRLNPGIHWSIPQLAKMCGYHPTYFADLFGRLIGQPPKAFLMNERAKQAKRMLLTGEKLVNIAETLGYGSVHYFSHNFKKMTGLSPSQYRMHSEES
ncbi:helix-turn-helix transcriptional regulator [Cohnella silvisoli]|uniref:Helix-turn-helix domain-containing protein n=1 Tax=Cohnella silvisoli TaxID=2873699 RepID=A0ABV1KT36_9BACL|nr:helix-turn-helix domain-containing protein [Cohnella silvisoli]MCD9021511.1 helix-turn-helix domain-containing protein [Cohnella silvisoli]